MHQPNGTSIAIQPPKEIDLNLRKETLNYTSDGVVNHFTSWWSKKTENQRVCYWKASQKYQETSLKYHAGKKHALKAERSKWLFCVSCPVF